MNRPFSARLGRFFIAAVTAMALAGCETPQEMSTGPKRSADGPRQTQVGPIAVCSFNIQWLGNSKQRDNKALAQILAENDCDIVAVQEMVAPPDLRVVKGSPYYGQEELPTYPGTSEPHKPNDKTTDFFNQMAEYGFDKFLMSAEKTGPGAPNYTNSSAAEWFVTFYRSELVDVAEDLPNGFIDDQLWQNPNYDRVPYAFSFRDVGGTFDFVLISVHLHPGAGSKDMRRREVEFKAIFEWVARQRAGGAEQDFIILGDTNIENAKELEKIEALGAGMKSLNIGALKMTNTNNGGNKPYDHVFLDPVATSEIKFEENFDVLNLVELMRPLWAIEGVYPGDPYNHTLFRLFYSDHHPVRVMAVPPASDDD